MNENITRFSANRIEAISTELSKFWLMQGRTPDPEGLRLMVAAIESELPGWIGGDLAGEAIRSYRRKFAGLPKLNQIIDEAEWISNSRRKNLPALSTHKSAYDANEWTELASHRILSRIGHQNPDPTKWVLGMMLKEPTQMERNGFIRLFITVRKNELDSMAEFWGTRNPYGLSNEQILQSVDHERAEQENPQIF